MLLKLTTRKLQDFNSELTLPLYQSDYIRLDIGHLMNYGNRAPHGLDINLTCNLFKHYDHNIR